MRFIDRLLGPVRVEHTVPPADVVDPAARVARIDLRLAEIAALPAASRTDAQWHELDRLFDLRNAIRSARAS